MSDARPGAPAGGAAAGPGPVPGPRPRASTLLLVPGILALLAGLWTGLARVVGGGMLTLPGPTPVGHGPLMVGGFLGTVIGLERAVALAPRMRAPWPFLAPALCGLGAILLMVPGGTLFRTAAASVGLGSVVLAAIFVRLLRERADGAQAVMALGAGAFVVGNVLWWGRAPLHEAALWWAAFVVLVVAGERLELTRVVPRPRPVLAAFGLWCAVLLAGLAVSLAAFDTGVRLAGAALAGLGFWLVRFDLAPRALSQHGLARFVAAALVPGYAWLVVAGFLWITHAADFRAGPLYDAMLHAVFVGFALSMIMGHAPIIFPGVTGLRIPHSPAAYAPLALLHAGLVARLAGDLLGAVPLRHAGAGMNVVAVLLFLANTVTGALSARRPPGSPSGP